MSKKPKPTTNYYCRGCNRCDEVYPDARVEWDVKNQKWKIFDVFTHPGSGYCVRCGNDKGFFKHDD